MKSLIVFLGVLFLSNLTQANELVNNIPFALGQTFRCQGTGTIFVDKGTPARVGRVDMNLMVTVSDQYPGPQTYEIFMDECNPDRGCGSTWGGGYTFELRGDDLYKDGTRVGSVSPRHLVIEFKTPVGSTISYEANLDSTGQLSLEKKAYSSNSELRYRSLEQCKGD